MLEHTEHKYINTFLTWTFKKHSKINMNLTSLKTLYEVPFLDFFKKCKTVKNSI